MLAAHDQAGSFGNEPVFAASETVKQFAPGDQIGAFRVEALLGAGGMGEVYRALDTRLGRAVAIKVLPDSLAHDAGRRSRFEHEARALAALNHPHIGAIYGVEESGSVAALVLELVDGPTLAERLAAGPIALAEIESMARQIAEGLEAAHDRGIVHRDLKPANIKVTPDGTVKILDFGLAKAVDASALLAATDSVIGASPRTQVGVIVGTAAYMSPEQARGQPVDKRTDIWAFGCVLFEMCARRPPFGGATVTDTLAAVIEHEPDWTLLDSRTPAYVLDLLRRCLTKDVKLRLRDIGEARVALGPGRDAQRADVNRRRPRAAAMTAVVATLVVAGSIAGAVYRRVGSPLPASAVRFLVFPPEGGAFSRHPARTFFALSPDGSRLAFVAGTDRGRVWIRPMAELEARPIPGTEGATSVFWSPDGNSVAFFSSGKLKRVELAGGAVVTVCDFPASTEAHGTWGRSGVILIGTGPAQAIYSVAAAGGTPRVAVTPNRANGEVRVHWPFFLPDGKRFLYTVRRTDGEGQLRIGGLNGDSRALMTVASNTQWVDPDVVVFAREGVLLGQRVDVDAARTIGEPFSVAERVDYLLTTSRALFSVSQTGSVAYHADTDLGQLVWTDYRGNEVGTVGSPADYEPQSGRLSSDGTLLLTSQRQPGLGTFDIWRHDLVRQNAHRLTDDRGVELTPIFVDGERAMIFSADRGGAVPSVFRRDLVTGVEEQLRPSGRQQLVMDFIPWQNTIVYVERSETGRFDILRLALAAGGSPEPLVRSRLSKYEARTSPDGRAIAFIAEDPPKVDLYVAPLPLTDAPILAVADVAGPPRWSADGRQIYYLGGDTDLMMTVPVRTEPAVTVGAPRQLFRLKGPARLLDVSRDGRFLLVMSQVRANERPISVATAAITSN
jgi:Tol biopolymer transport system component